MLTRKGFRTLRRSLSPVFWMLLLAALGFAVASKPQATDPLAVAEPVPDSEAASETAAGKPADSPSVVALTPDAANKPTDPPPVPALTLDTVAASQAAASKQADPLPPTPASPVVKGERRVPPIRRVRPKTPKTASPAVADKSGKKTTAAALKGAAPKRITCAKGQMLNRKTNTCAARVVQPAVKKNAKAP